MCVCFVCVCVCTRKEGGKGPGGETSCLAETKLFGKPPSSYRWPASRIRQATAVMSAAPLPLPSSDWRKVTSHFGDNCFTVSCMTVEKLRGTGGEGGDADLTHPGLKAPDPQGTNHTFLRGSAFNRVSERYRHRGERRMDRRMDRGRAARQEAPGSLSLHASAQVHS